MIINHFAKKEVDLWEEERKREREGEEERETHKSKKWLPENNNRGKQQQWEPDSSRNGYFLFFMARKIGQVKALIRCPDI